MFGFLYLMFQRISDALGVHWAPRDIPFSRRLQTVAATGWICLALFGEVVSIFVFIKILYSSYWWLALLYAVFMLWDIDTPNKGGRRIEWARNWAWWRYYRDYFPVKLVKTAELDPSKNYLLACFPHGVICAGAFGSFATNALEFCKIFPGLTVNMIILGGHFLVPLFRDLAMALGGCSSSSESLLYLLDQKRHRGKCVALLVGGAAEALDAHPGEYKILLNKRKGFIKIAIKSGASLVPVFTFGETEVFRPINNPKDSYLRRFQEKVRQLTGISPILPAGRGIFQYSYGVIPLRTPIYTVVGAPMKVNRNLEPTDEEVDQVHEEFKRRLVELFEKEKFNYVKDPETAQLIIS